ncbi:MAG: Nramp family divalent metal transporter [Pirellulales bacterium]
MPSAVPKTFFEYIRSFGPGIIVVLTWLGAGDIVEVGVAGGNFGYALMWVVVMAVVMRFLLVSLIAKYQLCNQHGEGVLDGLARLHSAYPLLLLIATVVMGHIYCSYMTVGIGEACVNLTGVGQTWHWAVFWNAIALGIVFKPTIGRIESLFKVFLAVLSISLVGTALWVGPNPTGILEGTFAFKLPEQSGRFEPLLIAIGMIGAVGGSMMNLVYPYFLDSKGWRGPQYRRVQMYDFLLAMIVMIVLDLAIWTLGAELLYPRGLTIETMDDLPRLLSQVLGSGGRVLFYLGIFAAIYSSLVGHALGLGYLGSHAYLRWKIGPGSKIGDYRTHSCYRWIAVWCLVTPLVWTAPRMPGFVYMTLLANSGQVVLVPLIAGGLWWITARPQYIGQQHCNRWWENLIMLFLFGLALWGACGAVYSVYGAVFVAE